MCLGDIVKFKIDHSHRTQEKPNPKLLAPKLGIDKDVCRREKSTEK